MTPPEADAIARVVADLRAGRVRRAVDDPGVNRFASELVEVARPNARVVVVDATAIYTGLVAKDGPVWFYEDHPNVAPPWENAAVCYVNEHGNVIVMHVAVDEFPGGGTRLRGWEPAHPVDWDRVRWVLNVFVWVGGRSAAAGPVPTTGPMHLWMIAVYGDGRPADMRWVQLVPGVPREHWDMAHLVLLGALNFMACRNVTLVEPERPRAQRKRLAKLGVRIHVISVSPVGTSTRGAAAGAGSGGTPLTSVRGHFAEYGVNGKGLLFGRLAGRFWIPQYARGSAEFGESRADYRLVP